MPQFHFPANPYRISPFVSMTSHSDAVNALTASVRKAHAAETRDCQFEGSWQDRIEQMIEAITILRAMKNRAPKETIHGQARQWRSCVKMFPEITSSLGKTDRYHKKTAEKFERVLSESLLQFHPADREWWFYRGLNRPMMPSGDEHVSLKKWHWGPGQHDWEATLFTDLVTQFKEGTCSRESDKDIVSGTWQIVVRDAILLCDYFGRPSSLGRWYKRVQRNVERKQMFEWHWEYVVLPLFPSLDGVFVCAECIGAVLRVLSFFVEHVSDDEYDLKERTTTDFPLYCTEVSSDL